MRNLFSSDAVYEYVSVPNNNPKPILSREEIRAIYDQGPDAVIGFVEKLLAIIPEQSKQIELLTARVLDLEARLHKDSHNSGKPPSSDGLRKKPVPKSQRPKGNKPSGGQPGHPGSTLRMSKDPDHVIHHLPVACAGCGACFDNASLDEASLCDYEARQVFDLPPLSIETTEHRCVRLTCSCGLVNHGTFPDSVTQPVQYGERIKALSVYLTNYQLLPWDRTTQMLRDLFGCTLSEGILQSAHQRCAQVLTPVNEGIKQALQQKDQVHFDETGQRIDGKLYWLHVACTDQLTYYATHAKRGHVAMDAIGILPVFRGRAIHDAWSGYFKYFNCKHSPCNVHHVRELTFLAEEQGQIWAQRLKTLLLDIKGRVDDAKVRGLSALATDEIADFEKRYDLLIQDGLHTNPEATRSRKRGKTGQAKGRNLAKRLQKRDEVLAFLHDFSVPFDNNLAERDIRMMKVRQKVSGCFRTNEGAVIFGQIRGYLSTMRKQGHNMLEVLTTVIQGKPRAPAF
jgi:transposase